MNEKDAIIILVIVKVIILGFISIGACLYAIPLCCIRRFHTPHQLLTLNVCIAAFICATFWAIYFIMNTFYEDILWTAASCIPILYIQNTVVCQVLYALCVVSLNRLFMIIYGNKLLFRTKTWVAICVGVQWIVGVLLPLPTLASSLMHCFISGLELDYQIYALIIIAIIPTISFATTNGIIFIYARRSTRRVRSTDDDSAPTLTHRDARLLKHMIFMFAIFFFGWVPLYIIAVIDWNGAAISYVVYHGVTILPAVSLLIDVANLFLYNHELRRYFAKQPHNGTSNRAK